MLQIGGSHAAPLPCGTPAGWLLAGVADLLIHRAFIIALMRCSALALGWMWNLSVVSTES
jgi:hypothetical protein